MENCIVTESKLLIVLHTNFISCQVSFVLRCFYKSTLVVFAVARTLSRSIYLSFDLQWSFGFIEISPLTPSKRSKIQKKIILVSYTRLYSFPFIGRTNILLVNYDSWWQHQMSVRELRRDRPSGRFSKSRSPSFLPHSLPALLLTPFFARSSTLVPRSLLL